MYSGQYNLLHNGLKFEGQLGEISCIRTVSKINTPPAFKNTPAVFDTDGPTEVSSDPWELTKFGAYNSESACITLYV